MPGEIITLQVGQCGNQVGKQFWSQLCKEHEISSDGQSLAANRSDNTGTFFKQNESRYTPRALLIDLEPGAVGDIQTTMPGLFNDRNVHLSADKSGAGNVWSNGYDYGVEHSDELLHMLDKELDATDNFEGFQLLHSVSGGTGSGVGSFMLEALADSYNKKMVATYSVFPSGDNSDVVIQPYNTMLTLKRLAECADATVVFENSALLNIANSVFYEPPSFSETNQLISTAISGITHSLRFPSYMYSSMPSIISTLIPAPELHFLVPSYTPFTVDYCKGTRTVRPASSYDVLLELFDKRVCMVDQPSGALIAVYSLLRGPTQHNDITKAVLRAQQRSTFVPWSSSCIHVNVGTDSKSKYTSGVLLANTTSVVSLFQRTCRNFDPLIKKNAFLSSFSKGSLFQDGYDELLDAREVVQSVMDEYLAAQSEEYLDNATF